MTALKERDPLEITCADYLASRPTARWLRLTHCTADVDHLAVEQEWSETAGVERLGSRDVSAVYIPLRPEGMRGPPQIVVKRQDADILALVTHDPRSPAGAEFAHRVNETLTEPTQGLVHFGLELSAKEQAQLARLDLGLASDFVIVDRGSRPLFGFGLLTVGVGLGCLVALVWWIVKIVRTRSGSSPSRG